MVKKLMVGVSFPMLVVTSALAADCGEVPAAPQPLFKSGFVALLGAKIFSGHMSAQAAGLLAGQAVRINLNNGYKTSTGFGLGLGLGYDYVAPKGFVIGGELGFDLGGPKGDFKASTQIQQLGNLEFTSKMRMKNAFSVALRAGGIVHKSVLVYGKVACYMPSVEVRHTASGAGGQQGNLNIKNKQRLKQFALGMGTDITLTKASFVRLEYMHPLAKSFKIKGQEGFKFKAQTPVVTIGFGGRF